MGLQPLRYVFALFLNGIFMKITLDISEATHSQLKIKAAHEHTSMRALILRGIDAVHAGDGSVLAKRRLQLPLVKSSCAGSIGIDNERIDVIGFP